MRTLLAVAAAALAAAGTASAGGWATVGVASLPKGVQAGDTWRAEITVLRHARTPTDGAKPIVRIRHDETGAERTFAARPAGRTGVYAARVVFPDAGPWTVAVDNGLAATGYGESQTISFGSFAIAGRDGGGIPLWPFAVGAAVVAAGGLARLRGTGRRRAV